MRLTLIPIHALRPTETRVEVAGEVLTVDGVPYDLSPVPDGGEGWPEGEHPFVGPIRRIAGRLHVAVKVLLDVTAAPDQPTDPEHWIVDALGGPVPIPARRHGDAA